MAANQSMRIAETHFEIKNDQLAELVAQQRESILDRWVLATREQQTDLFRNMTDAQLYLQFCPTMDCLIYLLRTGDIAGVDGYMRELISNRISQGYALTDIERSIHTLQDIVLRMILSQIRGPEERICSTYAMSELHDLIALRVAGVYQELQQEEQRRFAETYELGESLSKTLDLQTVLDIGVRKLAENMSAGSAAILLAREGQHPSSSALLKVAPELASALPDICHALDCGPEHVRTLDLRAALCVVPDVGALPDIAPWSYLLASAGCKSLACVPLITAEQVLGAAIILMPERRDLASSEVSFLLAMVSHIATAVQNALLYDEARGKRDLDLLLSVGKLFTSSLDTGEVIRQIAARSAESVGADYSFVLLPDTAGDRLHVTAYYGTQGRPKECLEDVMSRIKPEGLDATRGPIGRIFGSHEPLLIEDYERYPDQLPEIIGVTGSMLLVPIEIRDRVAGVFALVSLRPGAFSRSDLTLAQGIADQAAIAIENARLYQDVQLSATEAQTLYRISTVASSTLELNEVLHILAREIAQIAGVGRTGLYLVDSASRALGLAAQIGFDQEECRSIEREFVSLQLLTDGGLEALQAGEPIMIPDPRYHTEKIGQLLDKYEVVRGLVLPMVARGELIGVAIVDDRGRCHEFQPSVIRLLSSVAATAATSIQNARLMQHEKNIAETLQKSLLPVTIPAVHGYEISATYKAALAEADVGGDFYDVFEHENGRICMLIGDVSGKGISAATYTAAGKYMLRAFAYVNTDPAHVMYLLNNALGRYMPMGMFITMFYGVLDTANNILTYANAGHDQPMLYSRRGNCLKRLEVTGAGLGTMPSAAYDQKTIEMDPGDVLLLYTDGATDVRQDGQFLSPAGLERIFLGVADQTAEQICQRVFQGVLEFGRGHLTDDVALLVLERI